MLTNCESEKLNVTKLCAGPRQSGLKGERTNHTRSSRSRSYVRSRYPGVKSSALRKVKSRTFRTCTRPPSKVTCGSTACSGRQARACEGRSRAHSATPPRSRRPAAARISMRVRERERGRVPGKGTSGGNGRGGRVREAGGCGGRYPAPPAEPVRRLSASAEHV